jgi:protein SCO1/2
MAAPTVSREVPEVSREAPAAARAVRAAAGAAPTTLAAVWDNRRMAIQSNLRSFILLCAVGIAGIAASLLWRHPPAAVDLATGTFLAPSRALPDFSLIDQRGRIFGSANLRGHWSLLFFGYTNCPDFCPTTLTTLAAMQKRLRADKAAVRPQVIFVSVDAKRDTPEQLAKYVPYFDPEFIGLTAADQPSIEAVAKNLGVGIIIRPTSDGNYTVDHSAEIMVLDPDGRLTAILTGPFTVEALQGDFQRIVATRAIPAARA